MKITVYGAGYVGLVSSVCLAKLGHQICCVDINDALIKRLLAADCPIYEDKLPALLKETRASGSLLFTTDLDAAIQHASIHLIATGTPAKSDGNADLSQIFSVVKSIIDRSNEKTMIIVKSTVPVGTGDAIEAFTKEQAGSQSIFVGSNPEFLREGTAVNDFLNADRIIFGGDSEVLAVLKSIYQPLIDRGIPCIEMDRRSAELSKHAANAFLACKISFINQISQLAECVGANIDDIREGMSLDPRIGPHFLQAGIGYGGSCLPKDVQSLIKTLKSVKMDSSLLESVDKINQQQKNWVFTKCYQHFKGQLHGLKIGILGLSFKPETNDLREASSLALIQSLVQFDLQLFVYDPVARSQDVGSSSLAIAYCNSMEDVLSKNLDALVIATEWDEFKHYSLEKLQSQLGRAPLFDGRNCFDLKKVKQAGLVYYSVGRPHVIS